VEFIAMGVTAAYIHNCSKVAVHAASGKFVGTSYNNRGKKFRTIKMDIDHLTEDQLDAATKILDAEFGDRFVTIRNGIATGYSPYGDFDYPKVTAKFRLLPSDQLV
jgi:hypothetical protein